MQCDMKVFGKTAVHCPTEHDFKVLLSVLDTIDGCYWRGVPNEKPTLKPYEEVKHYIDYLAIYINNLSDLLFGNSKIANNNGYSVWSLRKFNFEYNLIKDNRRRIELDDGAFGNNVAVHCPDKASFYGLMACLENIKGCMWSDTNASSPLQFNYKNAQHHAPNVVVLVDNLSSLSFTNIGTAISKAKTLWTIAEFTSKYSAILATKRLQVNSQLTRIYVCKECKDTGEYVGLFERETCKACGGKSKQIPY